MFSNHLSVPISKPQQQTTFGPLSNRMFHSDFPRYSSMIPSPLDITQPISAVGAATTITTYTPVQNDVPSATASTNTTEPTNNNFPSFRKSFTVLDHGQVGIQEMLSEEQHICQQQMKAAAKTLQHQSNGRFVMLTFVDDCLQATELPTDGAINQDDEFTTESNTTIGTATAVAEGEQQAAPPRVLYTVRYDQIVMFKISRKDRSFLYFCARRPRSLMLDDCSGDEATNNDSSSNTEINNNNNNNKQCRKSLFGSNSDCTKTETGTGTDSGYQYNCYIYHATNSGAALRIYNLLKHSFILVQKMAKTGGNNSGSSLQSAESASNIIAQIPTTTTLASKLQTPFIGSNKIRNKKDKTKSNDNLNETIRNDDDDNDSQKNNSNSESNSNSLLLTIDNLLSNNVDETTQSSNSNVLMFDQLSMNDSNILQSSSSVSTSSSSVQSNPTGHTSSVDLLASLIVPPPPPPIVQQYLAPSISFSQQHQQYANVMSQYLNDKPMMMTTPSIGEQSQQTIMSKNNPFLNLQMAVPSQPISNSFNSNPFLNHHHQQQQQQPQHHVYPSGFPTISNFPKAYSGGASIASNQNQAHMPDIVSSHTTVSAAPSVAPYPGPNYSHQNFVQKSSEQPLFNSNFNDFLSQTVKKHFHKQPLPTLGQRHLSSTISLEQESNLLL